MKRRLQKFIPAVLLGLALVFGPGLIGSAVASVAQGHAVVNMTTDTLISAQFPDPFDQAEVPSVVAQFPGEFPRPPQCGEPGGDSACPPGHPLNPDTPDEEEPEDECATEPPAPC